MSKYQFHYFSNGEVEKTEMKISGDDLDALKLARKMCRSAEVVIWDRQRFVARVKPNDAPPSAGDRNGG